jgi:hypothetical protein
MLKTQLISGHSGEMQRLLRLKGEIVVLNPAWGMEIFLQICFVF